MAQTRQETVKSNKAKRYITFHKLQGGNYFDEEKKFSSKFWHSSPNFEEAGIEGTSVAKPNNKNSRIAASAPSQIPEHFGYTIALKCQHFCLFIHVCPCSLLNRRSGFFRPSSTSCSLAFLEVYHTGEQGSLQMQREGCCLGIFENVLLLFLSISKQRLNEENGSCTILLDSTTFLTLASLISSRRIGRIKKDNRPFSLWLFLRSSVIDTIVLNHQQGFSFDSELNFLFSSDYNFVFRNDFTRSLE